MPNTTPNHPNSRSSLKTPQVKAMRVSRCVDVAAGSRHTLAITERSFVEGNWWGLVDRETVTKVGGNPLRVVTLW